MRNIFYIFEKIFSIFSLIIYSGGFLSLIVSGGASEGDLEVSASVDSSFVLIIFQCIYIVTFIFLFLRWEKVFLAVKEAKLIPLLVLFAILSTLWSLDPSVTIVRCIALIGTSLFGLYLATRYTLEEQLNIFRWTFWIVIIMSFFMVILIPKYGIMGGIHTGAWRGIYVHKNVLGKMMLLSSLIFLLHLRKNTFQARNLAGLSLSIILLILAKSSGSLISLLILISAFYIIKILKWKYELMIPSLLAILTTGSLFILLITENLGSILGLAGKDPTLTGRTDFWILVINNFLNRPWLGHGYGAFWEDSNSSAALIRYAAGWPVPNAHNGLLDISLDLGIVGVLILTAGILSTIIKALPLVRNTNSNIFLWPTLFLVNMILVNLAETTLMVRNDIFWVMYIAVFFSVYQTQKTLSIDFNSEIYESPSYS